MRIFHLLATAALVLAVSSAAAAPGEAQTLDRILKEKKIRITAELTSPPFGIISADGQPDGAEVETALDVPSLPIETTATWYALPFVRPLTRTELVPTLTRPEQIRVVSSVAKGPLPPDGVSAAQLSNSAAGGESGPGEQNTWYPVRVLVVLGAVHDTNRPLSAVAAVTPVGATGPLPPRLIESDGSLASRVPFARTMAHR